MYYAASAAVGPAPDADTRVPVGRVSGVFGVHGWVRVTSYTDPPENILRYHPWLVGNDEPRVWRVLDGAKHGRGVVAHLDGVDDRDLARGLIGLAISVPRTALGDPAPGEYYWSDLVGRRVINVEGVDLGSVEDLLATGANDVLVVVGNRRRLVPFVLNAVIKSVDLQVGLIRVDWDPQD